MKAPAEKNTGTDSHKPKDFIFPCKYHPYSKAPEYIRGFHYKSKGCDFMEKERCAYARFSFDKDTQNSEEYTDKKAELENTLHAIEKDAKILEAGQKMLSVEARFSDTHNLSICRYKDRMFVGLKDKETKKIEFEDTHNSLVKTDDLSFEQLETRMHNAMVGWANKGMEIGMVKDCNEAWEQQLPVLDEIVAFEEKFEKLTPVQQRIYTNSKLYDQKINDILERGEKALQDRTRLPGGRQAQEPSKTASIDERFQRAREEATSGRVHRENVIKKDSQEIG